MNTKSLIGLVIASIAALSGTTAHAGLICHDLSINPNPPVGVLSPVPCATPGILNQLIASKQFKDVKFLVDTDPVNFAYTCYVSTTPISLLIDNQKQVTATSLSAWINDFDVFGVPIFLGGTGNIATVATRLTLSDYGMKYNGRLFTRDTIDFTGFPNVKEIEVVIGGTKNLTGAKGTFKLDTVPNMDGTVQIRNVDGKLCVDD